jgi:MerR-like DNA binding protein
MTRGQLREFVCLLAPDTMSGPTVDRVPTSSSSPPSWTVGELSDATGLSVRVLRHWEQLGLISPARTASGHRRYGPEEITRLYRAMACVGPG